MNTVLDDFTALNETTTEHYGIILIKVMMNLIESSKGIEISILETTMQGLTHEIK